MILSDESNQELANKIAARTVAAKWFADKQAVQKARTAAVSHLTDDKHESRIAGEIAARESAWDARTVPPADDHAFFIREYSDHAADALCDWANLLIERAEARCLAPYPTLDIITTAVIEFERALDAGASDDAIDAALEAIHSAISDAKYAAEMRCQPDAPYSGDQAEELETSPMRGWARKLDHIEECRRRARDAPQDAVRWQIEAAHSLVFGAPLLVGNIPQ